MAYGGKCGSAGAVNANGNAAKNTEYSADGDVVRSLCVALVQHRAVKDIALNTAAAVKFIREAKSGGADMVLFPECFLTSYYAPRICGSGLPDGEIVSSPEFCDWCRSALADDDAAIGEIRAVAAEEHTGVVITALAKGVSRPQNVAYVIDRDGKVILKYAKVHTCDFDWERFLESGDRFSVCTFDGINLGVMICYDREYPESARDLFLQGAELILVPNDCCLMRPRLAELSVAAMQNMCGVAMANPPGDGAGSSCAFDPEVWNAADAAQDNLIVSAGENYDGIIYARFNMADIRALRRREDMGKYRKPVAYRHLV